MQEYEITTASGIKLTVLLDEESAKKQGLEPVNKVAAPKTDAKTPLNKTRRARNKSNGVADSTD